MSAATTGALIGALGGLGLVIVAWRLSARRITLDDRLAPYLRVQRPTSSLLREPGGGMPFPTLARLLAPVMSDAVRLVERLGSPTADVRRRIARAGRQETVEQVRAAQVLWGVVGLLAGLVLALMLASARGSSPVVLAGLVALSGVSGVLGRDALLTRQVRQREERLLAELPTVAELLALAVVAGEGPVGALERVVRSTRGALADELARTLADVLRAQAQDVRESGRRALMEQGGRKEVLMMIPVVFLILPITVAFAVFPSFAVLRLSP